MIEASRRVSQEEGRDTKSHPGVVILSASRAVVHGLITRTNRILCCSGEKVCIRDCVRFVEDVRMRRDKYLDARKKR